MNVAMVFRAAVVAVMCCTMLVGCKGCKKRGSTTEGTTGVDTIGTTGIGDTSSTLPGRGAPGTEDRAALQAQTLYFAYDSAAINPNEQPKLQAVATYMKANPGVRLLIEGHCDERGTSEYNRALGERRALAAREALIGLGVDGGSVQTISYGEDKPADPGHDEAAWAKNRRAEFVVLH